MFINMGKDLDIDPNLLKAVVLVECGGFSGNLPNGEPKILFEGHIFYRELKKVDPSRAKSCLKSNPNICYESWTKKFYLGGEAEYQRYNSALRINDECARLATSWGLGQIMGFNYKYCGCQSSQEFVDKNREGEEQQLRLWYHFLYNQRLIPLLKEHNWEEFTRKYNGPGQVDVYSQKLINAFNNLKGKL